MCIVCLDTAAAALMAVATISPFVKSKLATRRKLPKNTDSCANHPTPPSL
jgi:hypothetical protein